MMMIMRLMMMMMMMMMRSMVMEIQFSSIFIDALSSAASVQLQSQYECKKKQQ
jgi:hypothetical protein